MIEKDILKLCEEILDTSASMYDIPNGAYESTCPFCGVREYRSHNHPKGCYVYISDMEHEKDCTYLIAKNISKIYTRTVRLKELLIK